MDPRKARPLNERTRKRYLFLSLLDLVNSSNYKGAGGSQPNFLDRFLTSSWLDGT